MPCCAVSKTPKSVVAAGSVTRAVWTSLVHVYRNNYDWWVYTPMLVLCAESMHARLLISRYVITAHFISWYSRVSRFCLMAALLYVPDCPACTSWHVKFIFDLFGERWVKGYRWVIFIWQSNILLAKKCYIMQLKLAESKFFRCTGKRFLFISYQ